MQISRQATWDLFDPLQTVKNNFGLTTFIWLTPPHFGGTAGIASVIFFWTLSQMVKEHPEEMFFSINLFERI